MVKDFFWPGAFGLFLAVALMFEGSFPGTGALFAGVASLFSFLSAFRASRKAFVTYMAVLFLCMPLYFPLFHAMQMVFAAFLVLNGGLALFVWLTGCCIEREHLSVLEYVRELGLARTPGEACGLAMEFIGRLKKYDLAAALLYDWGRDRLVLRGHSGMPPALTSIPRGRGVCWRVYISGKQEYIDDVRKDPDFMAAVPGMRSELCVPIEWNHKVHGVLNIESRRLRKFSHEDLRLVSLLAGILGQVLGHMLANEDLDCRYRQQRSLTSMQRFVLDLFHTMSTTSTLDELFNAVAETIHDKFGLGEVSIYVRESEQAPFMPVMSTIDQSPDLIERLLKRNQGIISRITETGKPYMTNDADADPYFRDDDPRIRSEIVVPISFGGRLLGFIDVVAFKRNAFSRSDLELLDLIGVHMAAELENKQILGQLDEGYERMRVLHEVTREAAMAPDLESMAERVVHSLTETMGYKAVAVFVPDGKLPGNGLPRMRFLASNLHDRNELEGLTNYLAENGGGLVARIAAKGGISHLRDVKQSDDYFPVLESIVSELDVPIIQGNRVMGLLSVGDENPFSSQDEEVYRILAAHLAAIWRIHELIERLETQALVDELTSLWNRRYIFSHIEDESKRVARYGGTFSVAMIDLADFKSINDRFGHGTGDTVLRSVGTFLAESSRECDVVARYGGDEFLLMMPNTDREGAEALLERLRRKARDTGFPSVPPSVSVGLDFGVASFPEDGMSFASVVQIADQRLYASKAAQQSVSVERGR